MTKRIDIVRCFWCDWALSTEDALLDPATGRIKCRACKDYDDAVALATPHQSQD